MSRDRDWSFANEKRDRLDNCCVVCGKHGAELAHITGRANDKKQPLTLVSDGTRIIYPAQWPSTKWIVHPHRVTLLCGPATSTGTCHNLYDSHQLNLLPYLSLQEQIQAVADAGGLAPALTRVAPLVDTKGHPIIESSGTDPRKRIRELP